MNEDAPLELELNSYVDGALDDEAMAAVERYLQAQPQAAARVREYLQQKNQIRSFSQAAVAMAPSAAIEDLERRLAKRLKRGALLSWRRVAMVAVLLGAGWTSHSLYLTMADGPTYTDEVIQAHILASSSPLDAAPLSTDAVVRMFALIGEQARVPDLKALGLEPIAAKLVPSEEGPVLQVAYRDAAGALVSFFVLHDDRSHEVPRHVLQRYGITLVYWQHEHSRYAVAAPLSDEQVRRIANLVEPAPQI
jgi:anti-sigma factor RsiW